MLQERGDALLIGSRNSLGIYVNTSLLTKCWDARPVRGKERVTREEALQDRCCGQKKIEEGIM